MERQKGKIKLSTLIKAGVIGLLGLSCFDGVVTNPEKKDSLVDNLGAAWTSFFSDALPSAGESISKTYASLNTEDESGKERLGQEAQQALGAALKSTGKSVSFLGRTGGDALSIFAGGVSDTLQLFKNMRSGETADIPAPTLIAEPTPKKSKSPAATVQASRPTPAPEKPKPTAAATKETIVSTNRKLLWIDAYNSPLTNQKPVDEVIAYAKKNSFGRIAFQVRNKDYFNFTNGFAGKPATCGFDTLAYLLEKTKGTGIEVFAVIDGGWVSSNAPPEYADPPDYTSAEVQRRIKEQMIKPLLTHPNFAGIILDRWRTRGAATEAQKQALTKLTKEIHEMTSGAGKTFAVAVLPDYQNEALPQGQDWASWAKSGIVDEIIAMDYRPDAHQQYLAFQSALEKQTNVPITALLPDAYRALGLSGYSASVIQQMAAQAQSAEIDVGIYSWASIKAGSTKMIEVPANDPGQKIPAECKK